MCVAVTVYEIVAASTSSSGNSINVNSKPGESTANGTWKSALQKY